jgi:drug/metabolite transporter (DMT)-like permease
LTYAVTVLLFVIANKLTTAANAILLQYTAPICVALFSFAILKEKVTAVDWGTIAALKTWTKKVWAILEKKCEQSFPMN